jgi:heme exporter protein A
MIEIKNLTFEREDLFDKNVLIDNLSLSVSPGELLIITGKNGQGKTTLLKLLSGILIPQSGQIFWKEQPISQDPENFYKQINYIGHKSAVALPLTPEENLYFASKAYALKTTIPEALAAVHLSHKRKTPASHLSAGQVRRIALAKLFLLDTHIWLLDEPYTALDTHGITWLQSHIHQHLQNKGIVIMTSHQAHGIETSRVKEICL